MIILNEEKTATYATVKIPVIIDKKTHYEKRVRERGIDEQAVSELVYGTIQQLLKAVTPGNKKKDYRYAIIDKQTCLLMVCTATLKDSIVMPQRIDVNTVYIWDGKSPLPQLPTIWINKDNPSEEWKEAEVSGEWYGHTWTNGGSSTPGNKGFDEFIDSNYDEHGYPTTYKGYKKLLDPQYGKNVQKALRVRQFTKRNQEKQAAKQSQINQMWDQYNADRAAKSMEPQGGWERRRLNNDFYNGNLHRKGSLNRELKENNNMEPTLLQEIRNKWAAIASKITKNLLRSTRAYIDNEEALGQWFTKQSVIDYMRPFYKRLTKGNEMFSELVKEGGFFDKSIAGLLDKIGDNYVYYKEDGLNEKRNLKEATEGTDDYYYNDAVEALEMSDGMLDFYEWYPAFEDELDVEEAEEIFNRALEHLHLRRALRESKLANIVSENIKKVLKEEYDFASEKPQYDINSDEYAKEYDKGLYPIYHTDDDMTDKEIADYEALPDKARHPYGDEIPDFSERIKNRSNFEPDDNNIVHKRPNEILNKQEEKREFERLLAKAKGGSLLFHLWCSRNNVDASKLSDEELVDYYVYCMDEFREREEKRREEYDY